MLEKKIFCEKKISKKFFFSNVSIYIPKCAESNFKKPSEWMLVSLTFLKKVIWEKTYFRTEGMLTVWAIRNTFCQLIEYQKPYLVI